MAYVSTCIFQCSSHNKLTSLKGLENCVNIKYIKCHGLDQQPGQKMAYVSTCVFQCSRHNHVHTFRYIPTTNSMKRISEKMTFNLSKKYSQFWPYSQNHPYMSSISRRKLNSFANGVSWYRFQRTYKILHLCENIFTEKESYKVIPIDGNLYHFNGKYFPTN